MELTRVMRTAATTVTLALVSCAAAWAQVGRGFDSGRIDWYPNMERAMSGEVSEAERRRMRFMNIEPTEKKYIFVYVRPVAEDRDPGEFQNADIMNAARGAWAFVKMDFDKDNAHLKAWGLKVAPACVTCDMKGNDFARATSVSTDQIRRLLTGTPELISRYEQKLKADTAKALEALKTDEAKAIRILAEIVATGKHGYKEVADAQARLNESAEGALRRGPLAESVGIEASIEYYDEIAKAYRSTPPGFRADIRVARLEHERGNAPVAIQKLQAIVKLDPRSFKSEIEEAQKALDEISKAGEAKLEEALSASDKAVSRESVRKLARDYAGTEAGRKAAEAAKRVD